MSIIQVVQDHLRETGRPDLANALRDDRIVQYLDVSWARCSKAGPYLNHATVHLADGRLMAKIAGTRPDPDGNWNETWEDHWEEINVPPIPKPVDRQSDTLPDASDLAT